MNHFHQSRQSLDTAMRLAAMGTTPHGVARVVLLYHEKMYETVQSFILCDTCVQSGVSLEQSKSNAHKLNEQCSYYKNHIDQFKQKALKQMIRESISQIDLSSVCPDCLEQFQQQLTNAFESQLEQQHIVYHVRRKKG